MGSGTYFIQDSNLCDGENNIAYSQMIDRSHTHKIWNSTYLSGSGYMGLQKHVEACMGQNWAYCIEDG